MTIKDFTSMQNEAISGLSNCREMEKSVDEMMQYVRSCKEIPKEVSDDIYKMYGALRSRIADARYVINRYDSLLKSISEETQLPWPPKCFDQKAKN